MKNKLTFRKLYDPVLLAEKLIEDDFKNRLNTKVNFKIRPEPSEFEHLVTTKTKKWPQMVPQVPMF